MTEDAAVSQARQLLTALYDQVADISHKLEIVDARNRRARSRGNARVDPRAGDLRRELYEAHRLIDGLHRRFPETSPHHRPFAGRHARPGQPRLAASTESSS
ncbi:hypothetical protein [Mycolicibacterium fluoranthenivorans]|uniref:Uncharacterized protein n=1 Tax=Mycolicibacterium fluoranthenivorans TaxID=258505 RepID=A0A7X5U398_9MYCO|nr:hypothetical protein [Mycolicibacterium fluoranthenivorans]MCV7359798.1 hypothetical protein [Mycolicibacterium fluoranthenivorans]NIH97653.1 hypothetical protein [Mycolicibacterium fluoranthenivorans]